MANFFLQLLPGNSDLLSAHDTWNSYQSMLRVLKRYRLPYRRTLGGRPVPGASMSMSSYPGVLYSGDDFTVVTDTGLVVIETTIGNGNKVFL